MERQKSRVWWDCLILDFLVCYDDISFIPAVNVIAEFAVNIDIGEHCYRTHMTIQRLSSTVHFQFFTLFQKIRLQTLSFPRI